MLHVEFIGVGRKSAQFCHESIPSNKNESWANQRKMWREVDYFAYLVCDAACIEFMAAIFS